MFQGHSEFLGQAEIEKNVRLSKNIHCGGGIIFQKLRSDFTFFKVKLTIKLKCC